MIRNVRTDGYNYDFNDRTGEFARWGKNYEDDPQMSPLGPELADIEISTICSGIGGKVCEHCYKSNGPVGKNMSLQTFKIVFEKLLPQGIDIPGPNQIAFGIGDINSNPDMLDIFWHCRDNGVIPNVTINGWNLSPEMAFKLAEVCGAVAVSRYSPKSVCYDAVKLLTDAGLEQVNIHQLASQQTFNRCFTTLKDMEKDPRLEKLNATVFLGLKKKGRGENYDPLTQNQFKVLVDHALGKQLRIGFDSCTAHKFLEIIRNTEYYDQMVNLVEPCESTLFSIYIDVEGNVYPCSFCEGAIGKLGNILEAKDVMEIWNGDGIKRFRNHLLALGRKCPVYEV